jgi:hypothetical protein
LGIGHPPREGTLLVRVDALDRDFNFGNATEGEE